MAFSKFTLVSYSDNDEFINGINFGVTIDQVKLIIEHFRNSGKWSEYYFHEIGDYSLTHTQLIDILNLRCIYWSDSDLKYFFSGWSVSENDPLKMAYSNNNSWNCIQSFDKLSCNPSHLYVGDDNLQEAEIPIGVILSEDVLRDFVTVNKHIKFDFDNFYYQISKKNIEDLIFDSASNWLLLSPT